MQIFPRRRRRSPASYGQRVVTINLLLLLVTLWAPLPGAMAAEPVRIIMLGDSITAGFGLGPGEDLPTQMQQALAARGFAARVENAGVSGDTSAGGLSRFDWSVEGSPDLIVIALGGNDGLRGVDPAETRRNLAGLIDRALGRGGAVLLAGMYAPPNMGAEYGAQFDAIYPALAAEKGVALYPFLLDGVAADPLLNQPDGIHPNAEGAKIIAGKLAGAVIVALKNR